MHIALICLIFVFNFARFINSSDEYNHCRGR
jgi:hypothetical protein